MQHKLQGQRRWGPESGLAGAGMGPALRALPGKARDKTCDETQPAGGGKSTRETQKTPNFLGVLLVAPTGVDPVTFRFSVERSTN